MLKKIIRPIFILWEKLFSRIAGIKPLENSPYKLLRLAVQPYKGEPLPLADGTFVKPGDYVAELHISNITISKGKVGNITIGSDIHLLPLFREEMHLLGQLILQGKLDPKVKALWGVTLFAPAVRRLGFSIRPLPPGRNRTKLKIWMSFLRWVFSPPKVKKPSKTSAAREPQEFWISIEQFVEKYGN